MWTIELIGVEATLTLGVALGQTAVAGTVAALHGDLGAGKTSLSQGVGQGLGIQASIVSPTFILMAEYEDGRLPLLHADAYRLSGTESRSIGLDEAVECWPGVALVEWAGRVPDALPADHLDICMAHAENGRTVTIAATGPGHEQVLRDWRSAYAKISS
jgi:tRNA threonylcarbamoyladenosine biosynthesis protein TsaE